MSEPERQYSSEQVHRPVHNDNPRKTTRPQIDKLEDYDQGQFLLYGNIADSVLLQTPSGPRLGALPEFLLSALLIRFDVVLSYDLGNGIRIEKGGELFSKWPAFQESQKDWKAPRPAIESLTRYFRYCANLARLNQPAVQVGCIIKNADLLAPPSLTEVRHGGAEFCDFDGEIRGSLVFTI